MVWESQGPTPSSWEPLCTFSTLKALRRPMRNTFNFNNFLNLNLTTEFLLASPLPPHTYHSLIHIPVFTRTQFERCWLQMSSCWGEVSSFSGLGDPRFLLGRQVSLAD